MKKVYFLIGMLTLAIGVTTAQNYLPMLDSVNLWHYNTSMLPVIQPPGPQPASACSYGNWYNYSKTQYTVHDTLIDSLNYKIVREETDLTSNPCDFGYVREDTAQRKIWFRDNSGNPEVLLYDFSLQVSDTILLSFLVNGGLYSNGTYTLDSIVPFQIHNTVTRMFCLRDHNSSWSPTLYWVEGVGCLMNAFYLHSLNASMGMPVFWQCEYYPQNSYEFMTCFDHVSKVYYDSCKYISAMNDACFMVADSCNYYNICGIVSENELQIDLKLFPAPAEDQLNISVTTPESRIVNIYIADPFGRYVKTLVPIRAGIEPNTLNVDISGLSSGTYFVITNSEGETYSQSFIKR